MYADRIEIVSVGGLITGFHLDDVITGLTICRNSKLANVFYRLSLIEAYGTGLKIILTAYYPISANQLFQVTEKVFKVTLPRRTGRVFQPQHSSAAHLTAEEMILEFLLTKEMIARADVEQMVGISSATAARILRKMVQSGMLNKTRDGRNTKYRLVKA